jgi:hypothetical protein
LFYKPTAFLSLTFNTCSARLLPPLSEATPWHCVPKPPSWNQELGRTLTGSGLRPIEWKLGVKRHWSYFERIAEHLNPLSL